jgi:D-alanyl-D-alanine carboxypeptidase (penicillin-binding protein 5/6)
MPPLLNCRSLPRIALCSLLLLTASGLALGDTGSVVKTPTATNSAAAKPAAKPATAAQSQKKPVAKSASAKKKTVGASTPKKPAAKKTPAKKKVVAKRKQTARKHVAKAPARPVALPKPLYNPEVPDAYPNVAKSYLVKVGDEVMWERDADVRVPPASLTKMMTALLVLESYAPNDIVTVSSAAAAETGSRIGLRSGDRLQLSDLLAAALIKSANDACHALADWHSGSEAVFVARMNQRAEQLGMRDTHFKNACGLDKPGHLSTARDMAILAEEALKNPTFARLVVKPRMVIRSVDGRRTFHLKTTNHLIGSFDGIQGVKTGFTNRAGPCLVAAADRDGRRVLLVLLNARNRWPNAASILDNAFAQLPRVDLHRAVMQETAATARTPVKGV